MADAKKSAEDMVTKSEVNIKKTEDKMQTDLVKLKKDSEQAIEAQKKSQEDKKEELATKLKKAEEKNQSEQAKQKSNADSAMAAANKEVEDKTQAAQKAAADTVKKIEADVTLAESK